MEHGNQGICPSKTTFAEPLRGQDATRRFIELVTGSQQGKVRWQISSPTVLNGYFYEHIATFEEVRRRLQKEQDALRNVRMHISQQYSHGEACPTGITYMDSGQILDYRSMEFLVPPDFITTSLDDECVWTAYWLISNGDATDCTELRRQLASHYDVQTTDWTMPQDVPGFVNFADNCKPIDVVLLDNTGHSLGDTTHWEGLHTLAEMRKGLENHGRRIAKDPKPFKVIGDSTKKSDRDATFAGFRDGDFQPPTDERDLIRHYLPEDALYMLYGPTQSLKTFVMLDVACSAAVGNPLWEHARANRSNETEFTIPAPLRVVFIAGEGAKDITKRIAAWKKFHQVTKKLDVLVLPATPRFKIEEHVHKLINTITEKFGYADILIIDTLMETATGWNMNDPADAQRFMAVCKHLRQHLLATICLIHHTGKDHKAHLGAEHLLAAVDVADKVEKIKQRSERTVVRISQQKARDRAIRDDVWLEGLPVAVGIEGDATSSLVLVRQQHSLSPRETNANEDIPGMVLQILKEQGESRKLTIQEIAAEIVRRRDVDEMSDDRRRREIDRIRKVLVSCANGSLKRYARRVGDGPTAPWVFSLSHAKAAMPAD